MPVPNEQLLPWLTGPYAALVLALIVIWGLWRLYQQEREERRQNFSSLEKLTDALDDLTAAVDRDAPDRRTRR